MFTVVLACQFLANVAAQTRATAPVVSKAQWRDDLRYFARELPKRHKHAFHATTQERFEAAVAALDAAMPSLPDHRIIVKLLQIGATVGDGHTGVHLPAFFKRYPINVYWFGRELRVIAASKEYAGALGTRVVKIGDLGVDEVASRVATCFPSAENENAWFVLNTSPAFIVRPEVLHTLGIVPELSRAMFTLEDDSGRTTTLDIAPVDVPPPVNGVVNLGLVPVVTEPPLYRQKLGDPFWFTYLKDSQTTYVNFKRYPSLKQNAQVLFQFIDRNPTARLVTCARTAVVISSRDATI